MKIELAEKIKRLEIKIGKRSVTGSNEANKRLMKELRNVYNSETFKNGELILLYATAI